VAEASPRRRGDDPTRADAASAASSRRSPDLVVLVATTAFAAVLRFAFLDQQSFWFDEAVTVQLIEKSFTGMLAALPESESTPPLYYTLAWAWSRLFGDGEVGLRSLSALLGTATVPAAYAAARLLVSRRAALAVAALVTCSPLLVWYSQEARAYALLVFLSTLSILALASALIRPSARAFGAWAAVAALALASHYFAVFLIGAEAIAFVLAQRRRRAAWGAVGVVGVAGGALLPLALHQEGGGRTEWIAARPIRDRISETARQFVTGEYAGPHGLGAVGGAIAVVLAAAGIVWLTQRERRGALLAIALGGAAVVAPLALAPIEDKFFYRNVLPAWVPLAVAWAAVVTSRRARRLGLVALAAACAIQLGSLAMVLTRPMLQRDDWRGATSALGPSERARVILTHPSYARVAVQAYRPGARAVPRAGAAVREIVTLATGGWPHDLIPHGFERVEQRQIQKIVLSRYRAGASRALTPARFTSGGAFGASDVLLDSPPR
jgi:4-amino-4-deoxy-L-arabinose transferase-like glycosyltransferase